MTKTYKYYNDDQELALQQTQVEYASYKKYEFWDDNLKIIYSVKNGDIFLCDYFLDLGEQIEPLIEEFCIQNQWQCTFFTLEETAGAYKLWKGDSRNNTGEITSKWKEVLDEDGFTVATAKLNLTTESIMFGYKRFLDINPATGKKEVFIQFHYKKNTFELNFFADPYFDWDLDESGTGMEQDFYLPRVMADFVYDDYPYFHNLLPLLPENGTIT